MFIHTDHAGNRGNVNDDLTEEYVVWNPSLVSLCRIGIHGGGLTSIRTNAMICRIAKTKAVSVIIISIQSVGA